jgi:hypothetical protein
LEFVAVVVEQRGGGGVCFVDDAADLGIDELLGLLGGWGGPGKNAVCSSMGRTAIGPIAALMPQRPTIWRASWVSCWMSDSAPVVISP